MTVYIGVDFHARQQTISYLTTEDGEIQRLQLDHGQPEEAGRPGSKSCSKNLVVRFGLGMRRQFGCLPGGDRRTIGGMLI